MKYIERTSYKIALICPYFGLFRGFFDFFIKSCEANPTIDFYFLLITFTKGGGEKLLFYSNVF